jgi:hypothetical protein
MDKKEEDHVSFRLFGMTATIQFEPHWFDPGLNGGEGQSVLLCALIGRHTTGEVFKAAGLSIRHPSDFLVDDESLGRKLALNEAAASMFWADPMAEHFMTLEQYQKVWWSAYQRKVHDQPDWTEAPSVPVRVLFI